MQANSERLAAPQILCWKSSIFGGEALDFQGMGIYPSDVIGDRTNVSLPGPSVHRQDESARLSLGMVASQQSPLPFHPAIDSTAN
jgi:hypothetical protein